MLITFKKTLRRLRNARLFFELLLYCHFGLDSPVTVHQIIKLTPVSLY